MKDSIINLLESSWKLREELWDSERHFLNYWSAQ